MKKLILIFILFFLSMSTSYASWTIIDTILPVQCNHWGWVYGNVRTVWKNACTPLDVKMKDQIISLATTANDCQKNEAAHYVFNIRTNTIELTRCIKIAEM